MSPPDTIHYSRYVDLHYSPDDGGWYAANYDPEEANQTTGIYGTAAEARRALDAGTAEWEV